MNTALGDFCLFLQNLGLEVPESIEVDGQLHRIASVEHPGRKDGTYRLFSTSAGLYGGAQNWTNNQGWVNYTSLGADPAAVEQEISKLRQEVKQSVEEKAALAKNKAKFLWGMAGPVDNSHPYLIKKGIPGIGIKQLEDRLIIPLISTAGEIESIQTIYSDGTKRFLGGGRLKGLYLPLGAPGDTVCLCEGYATGVSIHLMSGLPTVCAMTATNLSTISSFFMNKKLVICADDDYNRETNIGLDEADKAAKFHGNAVVLHTDMLRPNDWNDFYIDPVLRFKRLLSSLEGKT